MVETGASVAVANDKRAAVDPVRAGLVPLVPLLEAPALARVPFAATGKAGAVPLLYPVGAGALTEALELAAVVAAATGIEALELGAPVAVAAGTVYHC